LRTGYQPDLDNPITFKYISDFSYAQSSFTINAAGPAWGSACNFPVGIREPASASLTASVFPNPVRGIASVKVTVPQKGLVTVQLTNLVGQSVMNLSGNVEKYRNIQPGCIPASLRSIFLHSKAGRPENYRKDHC